MDNLNKILEENNFYKFEIITSPHENGLPEVCKNIISSESLEEKRSILKNLWQPFAKELQLTVAQFDNLQDAVVIKEGDEFKLI